MQKAVENQCKPQIVLLYCEHCTAQGATGISMTADRDGFSARLEMLPCSSKVETSHLLKIIERGADGVELVTCPLGACQFLDGNIRAERRINHARKYLGEIGMGVDRLGMIRGSAFKYDDLVEIAGKRAQAVAHLGANPMKGGKTR